MWPGDSSTTLTQKVKELREGPHPLWNWKTWIEEVNKQENVDIFTNLKELYL